jgi:hypothetical protein
MISSIAYTIFGVLGRDLRQAVIGWMVHVHI